MLLACFLLAGGVSYGQWIEDSIWVPGACMDILYNPLSNKVYVSLTTDQVVVIDAATNQVINTISVPEPQDLALNTNLNKVYCTSGEWDRLTVVDGVADTVVKVVSTPGWPYRMVFNAALNKLYVACTDAGAVRVVDGARDSLVKAVRVGSEGPEYMLWHPNSNRLFCSLRYQASVVVVDCLRDEIVSSRQAQLPQASCWNRVNDFAYLLTKDTIFAFTPAGDSVVARIPANIHNNGMGACFVPYPNKMYAFGGDPYRKIFVVDCGSQTVVETLTSGGSSGSLLLDSIAGKVYASGAGVRIFDAWADTLVARFSPGRYPFGMTWNWRNRRVYVAHAMESFVCTIRDTATAVAEPSAPTARPSVPIATVIRRAIVLRAGGQADLFDLSGRAVARLRPGANDARGLALGVYFVRLGDDAHTAKVVISR